MAQVVRDHVVKKVGSVVAVNDVAISMWVSPFRTAKPLCWQGASVVTSK